MPIDYKKYPPNWKELREKVLSRANHKCEFCGLPNYQHVWAVKYRGRTTGWYQSYNEANSQPKTIEGSINHLIQNPKKVKVILTIAHLDHDETNHSVMIDRLRALCQLCHLRYDAKEKYRRSLPQNQSELKFTTNQ